MPEATVNGFKMNYIDQGEGDVVMFLHGLGGNGEEWDDQIPFFSKRLRVIAPDLRGHGRSDPPETDTYTPYDHAKDVVAFIDGLGLKKVWLVGLSAGGFTTLVVALQNPECLNGVVLAGSAPFVDKDTIAIGEKWVEIFRTQGFDAYIDRVVKDIFTLDFFLENKEKVDKFIESQKHRDFKGIAPSAKGNLNFDVRNQLPKIHVPLMAIHGMNDRVVDPAYARRMRQAVVGAEVKLLPAGHIVNVEMADEFNDSVLDFISRHGGQLKPVNGNIRGAPTTPSEIPADSVNPDGH